jgi:hypothetical protein
MPFETVSIQLYTLSAGDNGGNLIITQTYKQRIGDSITSADEFGNTFPKDLVVPNLPDRTLAVVAIGQNSNRRITRKIRVV